MALTHSPKIVTDGLIQYLDAANPKSYPGTGTAWFDLSVNKINAALVSGPTFNTTNGGAFTLDGVNDYIDLSLNSLTHSVFGDATFSFIIWFKLSQFGSSGNACGDDRALIIGRRLVTSPVVDYYHLDTTISSTSAQMRMGNFSTVGTSNALTLNNYCCFAGIRNKSAETFQSYRDGKLTQTQSTASIETYNHDVPIVVGGGVGIGCGDSQYMFGDVSVVMTYSRTLTAAEVSQNFNALRGRYGV